MSGPFRVALPLRFAHCDPAGIAYFPRLLELCDAAVEDWTAAVIGVDRRTMHGAMGLGMPTVDLQAGFAATSRLGDRLDLSVAVERVGRSSVGLGVEASCGGERRFGVRFAQVLVRLSTGRPEAWPDGWRARLEGAR